MDHRAPAACRLPHAASLLDVLDTAAATVVLANQKEDGNRKGERETEERMGWEKGE